MTTAATDPEDAPPDPREARAERRLAMLEHLAEIGMALARDLSRRVGEALQASAPLDGGAVALEFSRVSRAVRQTIALEARLDQDREALAKMFAAERQARDEALTRARTDRIEGRREAVRDAVMGAIERVRGGQRTTGPLREALDERLEDPREDDDLADLPVSELVGRVCAALGVAVDWDLWKNTEWAAEEWRAAVPGSPYAPMAAEGADGAKVDGAKANGAKADDAIRLSAPVHAPPRRSG